MIEKLRVVRSHFAALHAIVRNKLVRPDTKDHAQQSLSGRVTNSAEDLPIMARRTIKALSVIGRGHWCRAAPFSVYCFQLPISHTEGHYLHSDILHTIPAVNTV